MKKIILASSSPRRIEMMKNNGYDPAIIPADVSEKLPMIMTPAASVMYLALKKAAYVKEKLEISGEIEYEKIIAADTVVVKNNKVIGKPQSKEEAFEILSSLRKDSHNVLTGVCIIEKENSTSTCFYDSTRVFFKNISDEELTAYVSTPEPYDKAGGYAINQTFSKYLDHIEGDFNNVIGLPWYRVKNFL